MATLTYDQMRTNADRIADEAIKERVLRGIALLNEKHGPDWVDHIDLDALNLRDGGSCVLGQVYADDDVPKDAALLFGHRRGIAVDESDNGYWKGQAILDGPLLDHDGVADHGFSVPDDSDSRYAWSELQDAWLTALGAEVSP